MRKFFLLVAFFLPLLILGNSTEVKHNDLNIKGTEAFKMQVWKEAFCAFDLQLVYFRKEEDHLERLEAQIGRFCAAYQLGYTVLVDNDFYLIHSLKFKTEIVQDLLKKYPNSMINYAREIMELIYYSRNIG